jgi:cyclophilin family peptidyl-prolyl cis-trans isomerase/HEAT repeat protein
MTETHVLLSPTTNRLLPRLRFRGLCACAMLIFSIGNVVAQNRTRGLQDPTSGEPVTKILLLRIVRAEDERRWDDDVRELFSARNANVRARAALAAGRIGDEAAVAGLIPLLQTDDEPAVRAMAAFALGEIESPLGADALVAVLKDSREALVRARAVEALGKITAALPKEAEARTHQLAAVVLGTLKFEARRRSAPDDLTILLALTAVLRTKPEGAGPVIAEFLHYSNPRIRADAANTLARLKLKDGNEQLRKLLVTDPDAVVRANAARVLGATEDETSAAVLLNVAAKDVAAKDKDSRVRVSAIRSLALLKYEPAAQRWLGEISADWKTSETLERATALGRILEGTGNKAAFDWLTRAKERFGNSAPEVEIALARVSPSRYLDGMGHESLAKINAQKTLMVNWRAGSSLAQGLGEIAALPDATKDKNALRDRALNILGAMLDYRNSRFIINTLVAVHSEYAIPDVLQAYAAFKTRDLAEVARGQLKETDVIVRGAAAGILAELPPDKTNADALIAALPVALADAQLNDAALAILDALGKQKSAKANDAIKTAVDSPDHLIRRKAVAVLKENGVGDFSSHIGVVKISNTPADYERALARIGKNFYAVVTTTRGSFTIELLPEAAPLNVDNFIQLARRGYFGGITIHRVVPNFVIQDGDPRGDGNGGPGYQIRCEINQVPYERGAVGMALSGKDTGGSQWFVTHSPQPHLNGGYTVFGNVTSGMAVVDNIIRGDVIRSISITETLPRGGRRRLPQK